MTDKKKKKNDKKQIVKEPQVISEDARIRRKPVYKSFRLHKHIKTHRPPIATWWELTYMSLQLMWVNRRALFSFTIVYGVLTILLVRGFTSPIDTSELELLYEDLFGGELSALTTSLTTFGLLLGASAEVGGDIAQIYQSILILLASLAIIWLYRQQQAGNRVTMKEAFYRGMYPLVPFLLILGVIALQFLPGLIGNFIYTAAITGDLLFGAFEHALMITMMLSLLLLSLYMISSSGIALYIVTLPEMTPLHALREARELVRHRRLAVLLRFIMLILIVLFILLITTVPVIFFAPAFAEWVFFLLTILAVPFVHGYLFSLYREVLA